MNRPKILIQCSDCEALVASGRIFRGRWKPAMETACPSCCGMSELSTWTPFEWDPVDRCYVPMSDEDLLALCYKDYY